MSYPRIFATPGVGDFAEAVDDERRRQLKKWGDQRHPDGAGGQKARLLADEAREHCQRLAAEGDADWRSILLEEVYEALAEGCADELEAELIQCAAVIQAWVWDIRRRRVVRQKGGS